MTTLADIYFPIENGTYAFAPLLEMVRHHIFPTTPLFQQGFLSRDKEADNPSKEFLAVNHFAEFVKKDIVEAQQDRHLYELVTERTAVRPYFDLEWYTEKGEDENELLLDALGVIALALQNAGFIGRGISIYTASGPVSPSRRKASYHILCDTVQVFRNAKHHGEFIKRFVMPLCESHEELWYTEKVRKCVIDSAPYGSSQSFRLPYQSKWKSDGARRFVPFDVSAFGLQEAGAWTIGLYSEAEIIDMKTPHARPTLAPYRKGPSLEFAKVEPLCALLTVEFLTGYMEAQHLIYCMWGLEQSDRMCDLIHAVCRRAHNYEYKWVQNLIRSWKYSAFGIGSLVLWATRCSDKTRVSQVLKRHTVKYHPELFDNTMRPARHTIVHSRYLGDIAFDCNTLILQSALGTGKTVSITQLIRCGGYERILIVSPRKSYTYSQHGVFHADKTLPRLTCYLDVVGSLSHVDCLIVQAESLHRLSSSTTSNAFSTSFDPYDLVIMDESESILCQMHSVTTHGKNMIANHQVLERALVSARHVIFADAFLSDRTFHIAASLRADGHFIENTFQPYERVAIRLASVKKDKRAANLGGLCERIVAALDAGRRIVVIWTSRRRGLWFAENFLKERSYLFYHSGSSKEEQLGLRNVNESWKDVQCLMMTTSITVGISYDPVACDACFQEAFLYASSASALPRDIAQSLLRVRVLKANRLTYVLDTRVGGTQGGFTSVWNQMAWKEQQQEKDHPLVQWTACPAWVRFNHCYNVNEERISRGEYQEVLERYLVKSGYTLQEETHIPSDAIAAIPVELEDGEAIWWDNIDDVSGDAADDILQAMRRGEATAEEILCYKKWSFQGHLTCSEEDAKKWWERFYESGREAAFWNVVNEKRLTITEVASKEAEARYGIMTTVQIARRQTLARFLGILGLTHSQEEVVLDAERLGALGEPLQAAEKDIREGMGLRTSRKRGEWKVGNTIDLISAVLEEWGAVQTESVVSRKKIKNKTVRTYSLHITGNAAMWDKIINSNTNYDESLIKL